MKKILITGGSGQLGRECADLFAKRFDVVSLSSKELDITDPDSVITVFESNRPDIVINCAAFTNVDMCETNRNQAWEVNANGPGHLARATKKIGAKLVHISTDYVFNGQKPVPDAYVESDETGPVSWYGKTKLAGEQAVTEATQDHLIIRTAWLYSIHGGNFLKTMLRTALKNPGKEIRVVNDQFGSMTWAYRLALQIERLIDKGVQGICHASAEGYGTWYEVAGRFVRTMGVDSRFVPCDTKEYPTPAHRPRNSILENQKMKKESVCIMEEWENDVELFANRFCDQLLKEATWP